MAPLYPLPWPILAMLGDSTIRNLFPADGAPAFNDGVSVGVDKETHEDNDNNELTVRC